MSDLKNVKNFGKNISKNTIRKKDAKAEEKLGGLLTQVIKFSLQEGAF